MTRTSVNREPSTEAVIRFQDCDPFGHLNNARYIDYFINAREDHLADHYGLDIYERQSRCNTNWVVAKTKVAYLNPAIFRERVEICTRLLSFTHTTLLMEGVMTDAVSRDLKAIVWIEFRYFDLAGKCPSDHPEELMALFGEITLPGNIQRRFDARIRQIFRLTLKKRPERCR
jgi:acyl-CoA thioester hydrolase